MPDRNVALPFAGYIRVSRTNGRQGDSFISPEAQRESIEATARQCNLTLGEVVEELDVSGGKDIEARELGRLVQAVKDGKLGGVIVWNVKRYSREWLDGITVFDSLVRAGGRLVAEDFKHEGGYARSILSFILEGAEEERRQKTETWSKAVAKSVARGIHSGSIRPLGYEWPGTTIELGNGKTRFKKSGPLEVIPEEAARVKAGFEARADKRPWSEVMGILGVASQGAAANVIKNRVYLGEARSGSEVCEGAHKAIIDPVLYRRANAVQKVRPASYKKSKREWMIGGGILRCGTCGGSMVGDAPIGAYRCKRVTCTARMTVQADRIEPVVLEVAKGWHARLQPNYAALREADDAILPALDAAKKDAEEERADIEASQALNVLRRAEALTEVDAKIAALDADIAAAEAGIGWLGTPADRIEERLTDTRTTRDFIAEMVQVFVVVGGRGKKLPVEERIKVQYLDAGKTASGVPAAEFLEPVSAPFEGTAAPAVVIEEQDDPTSAARQEGSVLAETPVAT